MPSFVNQITVSPEDRQFFLENGFIKLKNLINREAIDELRKLVVNSDLLKKPPKFYSGDWSKIGYDVQGTITHQIYSSAEFQSVTKQLTERQLTFCQGIGFVLSPNQKGFAWHNDILSFCYILPQDSAYTLWIPLDAIAIKKQHGGLAYVSRKIYSVQSMFFLIYHLVQHEEIDEFCQTEEFNKFNFQYASKVEELVLDKNKVEDDFEVGDVLLMDKFVWHKSCPLKEGATPSRTAYVMRFLDSQARYSKVMLEGTYSLLEATGSDLQSDIGYQLSKRLQDGDFISKAFE